MSGAARPVQERGLVERLADTILYEGYSLYPYRPSAVKNQQRWNFGALCPRSYCETQKGTESFEMQTECLVWSTKETIVDIKIRFLHLMAREVAKLPESISIAELVEGQLCFVPSLEHEGRLYQTWQEAVEREVECNQLNLDQLTKGARTFAFEFPAFREVEELRDHSTGILKGAVIRSQQAISGRIDIAVENCGANEPRKLRVKVTNLTPFKVADEQKRDDALMRGFVSTHAILRVRNGEFESLLEPSISCQAIASSCRNVGAFPVLAGAIGARDCVLSSPIILYDYPQIAAESAGDLFDGTEIDEILMLRILTLTDEEKREVRESDDRARQILERTEMMPPEQFMKLHGAMKGIK